MSTTKTTPGSSDLNYALGRDNGDAAVIAAVVNSLALPVIVGDEGASAHFAILPKDKQVVSLEPFFDERATRPRRQKGAVYLHTVPDFLDFVKRYGTPNTAVYVRVDQSGAGALVAVLNHRGSDGVHVTAEFEDNTVVHTPVLSDPWKQWLQVDGKPLPQGDFAAFLQDHVLEIVDGLADNDPIRQLAAALGAKLGTVSDVMNVARGLTVHSAQEIASHVTLETGEMVVGFKEAHGRPAQEVTVPSLFVIKIPLFENGAVYHVPVRLRYRAQPNGIVWTMIRYQPNAIVQHAWTEIEKQVRDYCGKLEPALPVFRGQK